MLTFLKGLLRRPERPLNTLPGDVETVDQLLELMEDVRNEVQRQKRDAMELRAEWAEALDKLHRIASKFSARERMRTRRALEEEGDEPEPAAAAPLSNGAAHTEETPAIVPEGVRFMTKAQLRAFAAQRR